MTLEDSPTDKVTVLQLSITLAKFYSGYRPGDDMWAREDQEALDFALRLREYISKPM